MRSPVKRFDAVFVLALVLFALAPPARAASGAPNLIGAFQDWYAYSAGSGADRVCYVLSQPRDANPKNVRRDPIFFLVSSWPAKEVMHEPSIVPGYPYKEDSKARVTIGSDKFEFFTRNDGTDGGAWMEQRSDELRLVDAMKRGSTMIVTGTSTRGTLTTDSYSLAGVTAALDKIDSTCK